MLALNRHLAVIPFTPDTAQAQFKADYALYIIQQDGHSPLNQP